RLSSYLWATFCTTRTTTTCDVVSASFGLRVDALKLGMLQAGRHIAFPSEPRIVTWHMQHPWKRYRWRCRVTFRGAVAHDRHRLDRLSDSRGSFCDPSDSSVPGTCL